MRDTLRAIVRSPCSVSDAIATAAALDRLIGVVAGRAEPYDQPAYHQGFVLARRPAPALWSRPDIGLVLNRTDVSGRMRALLKRAALDKNGLILLSTHQGQRDAFNMAPVLLSLQAGLPTLTVDKIMRADGFNAADVEHWARSEALLGGRLEVLKRNATTHDKQTGIAFQHLRKGGAIQMTSDAADTPSRFRAFVPWFLRPHFLPVYASHLALSSGAMLAHTHIGLRDDAKRPCDGEVIPLPPDQGDLTTRAIWHTQRFARAVRKFHQQTGAPLDPDVLRRYGGAPGPVLYTA